MDKIKTEGTEDWVMVYSTANHQTAEIIKQLLAENEIAAVLMNRMDSMYPSIGEVDIFVLAQNTESAKKLIGEFEI